MHWVFAKILIATKNKMMAYIKWIVVMLVKKNSHKSHRKYFLNAKWWTHFAMNRWEQLYSSRSLDNVWFKYANV